MQRHWCVGALILASGVSFAANKSQPENYMHGTVVSVERQVVTSPGECCSNPTDAPLQTQYFAYDVAVRVNCRTVTGRYETPFDYLPSALSANHPIDVRLTKRVMYFNVNGEREIKMGIVQAKTNGSEACNSRP